MLKRILKPLRAIAIFVLVFGVVIFGWLNATKVTAQDLPPLKAGDIVFQTSKSSQSAAIFMASSSAYTHVGIIELNAENQPMVVEAVGPVLSTPLDQWIQFGLGGRIAVMRMDALDATVAQKILAAAHVYDGKPYDIYFMSSTDEIYCSELVHLAFAQGANIKIGKMQKVKDLNIENVLAQNLIKERWRSYPLCRDNANETFESCKAKIMEQELVTPVSIANDTRFKTIYSNYGLTAE
jgi:hypothetical protein